MSDMQRLRDQIKATVTMDDVCERLGIRIPRDRKIRSIYGPDKTPSLHLYKADFYDYSTGQGGDVIRFVMDHQGWSFPRAVKWIARVSSGSFVTTRREEEVPEDADLTDEWEAIVTRPITNGYYQNWDMYTNAKWGLDLRTVLAYGSTLAGVELYTPHWHGNKVRGIKVRTLYKQKLSVPGSKYTYGLYRPTLPEEPADPFRRAVIVEGESDTWALTRHLEDAQFDVYGLPSGAGLWRDSWRQKLKGYQALYVALDSDEAGNEATKRITGSLLSDPDISDVYVMSPPGGRVAEALTSGNRFAYWLTTKASQVD